MCSYVQARHVHIFSLFGLRARLCKYEMFVQMSTHPVVAGSCYYTQMSSQLSIFRYQL